MRTKFNIIRFIICLLFTSSSVLSFCQSSKVLILNIKEGIDVRTSRYIALGLEKAETEKYDLVFIDMNTYGGTVSDADKIVGLLLKEKIPTYVFVDNNAGSAGSYIAIACDSIYMVPGSIMGASTVVNESMEVMPEKVQAAMRKKMRSTAETTGRDPVIAEELVGMNLHSDSVYVRVLTNKEAIELNYCEGVYENKNILFQHLGLENAQIDTYKLDTANQVIDFFLGTTVKTILIILIFGGIYMELKTPGLGLAVLISFSATMLYFIPDYMHGLLAHWEILLFIIGLILIFLEVFVIPGFGIVGVTGIIFIFISLLLSMLQNDYFDFELVSNNSLGTAFRTVGIGFIGSMILMVLTASLLIKSKAFQRISLTDTIDSRVNTSESVQSQVGKTGIASTILRPSGKVRVDNIIYDATSRGGFIDEHTKIIVVEDKMAHLIVDIQQG